MNVLHVIAGIDPTSGGTTTALRNILHMESVIDVDHEVLTIRWGTPDPAICDMVGVYIARESFPRRFARSLDAIRWLLKNIERFDLIVIHGIWSWLPWKVSITISRLGKPYIICPHGSLDPFDVQKKRIAKKILGPIFVRGMLDRAAAVLCTAPKEARLVERYGAHPKMEALPLPGPFLVGRADCPSYTGKKAEQLGFRARWGLKVDDFVFLFLSRINYKKGLDILIPAFAMLVNDHPQIKLVIAGSDREGYGDRVKEWVAKWNVQSKVILPGFLQGYEKDKALAESNCFILPSLNENFALAVVEALGAGLPVIISENVYIEEDIKKANAGWVCNFSIDSLYTTMKQALDRPIEYKEKRMAATSAAIHYSPERIGKLYFELYEKVILNQDVHKMI